jgi:hypothetical protein
MTFNYPGYANSSCNGSGTINAYAYGNSVSGNTTSYANCNTTYTPPTSQNIDIQKPVVFVLADTDTNRLILTCTRNVRWSQCHALNPGFFMARNNKGQFEVQAVSGKGKEEWVKFDIVQQNAITPQSGAPTNSAAVVAVATSPAVPSSPTIEAPSSDASAGNMGFPSKWKSMTTGSIRTLRFEPNYIYGEVILPEAAAKAGAYTLMEAKKDGDKFVGKINGKIVRADGGASCEIHAQVELTQLSPDRIEGRSQSPVPNSKIDWAKCSNPELEWKDFVWIPVK